MICRNVKMLAATMVAVVLLAAGAWAQGPWDCGATAETVTATLGENGTLTISGTGAMENFTSVSSVPWDGSRSSITSVVIEDGVTSIGDWAFYGCADLTSVTMPVSLTYIGTAAFDGCGLTSVTIPDGVTSIGNQVFYGCRGLTSVTIPNSVISIGNFAFQSTGLTSVTIPNSTTSIGERAFYGCAGLTSVTIPNSVTSIGTNAFLGCTSLTSIETGDDNSEYSSVDGVLFNKAQDTLLQYPGGKQGAYNIPNSVTSIGYSAFESCRGLTSVTIGSGVTSIGNYAFRNCSGLTSVTIPNSVTSIRDQAFSQCTRLTSVTSLAEVPPTLGTSVFFGVPAACLLYVPEGSAGAYMAADQWNNLFIHGSSRTWNCGASQNAAAVTATLNTADGTLTISGTGAMADYTSTTVPWAAYRNLITGAVIEKGVTNIGNYAFYNCTGLTSVTIPSSVASIGTYVFSGCTGLTSVTLPTNLTSIGNYAFQGCAGLTSVTIPSGVTSIGTYVFSNCTGLTSVTIGNGVTSIGNYAFQGCAGLTSVTIPSSVTSIGTYVFYNCTGLTSVTIGSGVTSIGNYAFRGCTSLTSIETSDGNSAYSSVAGVLFDKDKSTLVAYPGGKQGAYSIPNGVTSIGLAAFYGCAGLTSVTIPNSVTSIGNSAFYQCTGLTSVTIPNGVTSIGTSVFNGCTGLTSIEAGEGNSAYSSVAGVLFDKDKSTLVVYPVGKQGAYSIPNGVMSVGLSAFYGCTGLTSVTIPSSVASIGNSAFYQCTGLTSVTIPNGVTSIGTSVFSGCTGLTSVTSLIDVPPTINSNVFTNVPVASATLYVPEASVEAYRAADVWTNFGTIEAKPTSSIATGDRAIPQTKPKEEATVIAPATVLSGEFTAGPNPVAKQSGSMNFYRQGKHVSNSELRIYDATGNVINKVKISDKALNSQARRQVGSWDLTDKNGRPVSEGTYLVKGVVKTSDGKSEKVSVIVGVR